MPRVDWKLGYADGEKKGCPGFSPFLLYNLSDAEGILNAVFSAMDLRADT